ncbi:ATP-dependent RNA helicase T26G10.1 [Schistosoma japonicum]|nr:ATP-dependent RNA helicase T26G10.1 [Schistosoma japonicum]
MAFSDLGLIKELCFVCQRMKWDFPTKIQSKSIPTSLEGKDVVGIAETGSGKTAAFLLPIIQHWIKCGQPIGFALILAPTRELAQQLANEAERLGQYKSEELEFHLQVILLVGGEDVVDQALKLAWRKHHIIVATPGRLVDHLKQSPNFAAQQLSNIHHLVLDEADRMLNMAFADDIDKILDLYEKPKIGKKKRRCKAKPLLVQLADNNNIKSNDNNHNHIKSISTIKYCHPQIYLFSATMTKDVMKLRRVALLSNAVFLNENDENINVTMKQHTECNSLKQSMFGLKLNNFKTGLPIGLSHYCLPIRLIDRPVILEWIVENAIQTNMLKKLGVIGSASNQNHRIMIFCKRCYETLIVAEFLRECHHSSVALTGRMKQSERKESLNKFISNEVQILVATDVASRGLDIPHVEFVINYSVPLSEKTYRHRVGRTARAGQTGIALTIVTRDVAQCFLELEASLLPYLPSSVVNKNVSDGKNSSGIPHWPIPLPDLHGRNGLLARRRLADQAWCRASKTIRSQLESQHSVNNNYLMDLDNMVDDELIEAYAYSDDSDDDDDDEGSVKNSSISSVSSSTSLVNQSTTNKKLKLSNSLETSGHAGITAARRTWKSIAKLHKHQKKEKAELEESIRLTKSIGWGISTINSSNNINVNNITDCCHNDFEVDEQETIHYEQPIKTKYAKIQLLKKKEKCKQKTKR